MGCGALLFFLFSFFRLPRQQLRLEIIIREKYPRNPPQPVPNDATTAVGCHSVGSHFSFPPDCWSNDFPWERCCSSTATTTTTKLTSCCWAQMPKYADNSCRLQFRCISSDIHFCTSYITHLHDLLENACSILPPLKCQALPLDVDAQSSQMNAAVLCNILKTYWYLYDSFDSKCGAVRWIPVCVCLLVKVSGHSSATSVVSRSLRREICCGTLSCTRAKNPSSAPSAAMPVAAVMRSRVICALMPVRLFLCVLFPLSPRTTFILFFFNYIFTFRKLLWRMLPHRYI